MTVTYQSCDFQLLSIVVMVLTFRKNKYTYRVHRLVNNDYNNYDHHLICNHNNHIINYDHDNHNYDVKYTDINDNYHLSSSSPSSSTTTEYSRITMRSISAMNYHAAIIIQKSFRGYRIRYMLWSYGQIFYNSKGNVSNDGIDICMCTLINFGMTNLMD